MNPGRTALTAPAHSLAPFVITLLLSVLALGEPFTARMGIGAALIIAGLVVLAGK